MDSAHRHPAKLSDHRVFQKLICNGHTRTDCYENLCAEEILLYYMACIEEEMQSTKRLAFAVRMGTNADKDGFSKFIDTLDSFEDNKDDVGHGPRKPKLSNEFLSHIQTLNQKFGAGRAPDRMLGFTKGPVPE